MYSFPAKDQNIIYETLFLSSNVNVEVKLGKVFGNRTTIKIVQEEMELSP